MGRYRRRRQPHDPIDFRLGENRSKRKTCVICGKNIRSGWKYCHEHRNTRSERSRGDIHPAAAIIGLGIFFLFMAGIFNQPAFYFVGGVLIAFTLFVLIKKEINKEKKYMKKKAEKDDYTY